MYGAFERKLSMWMLFKGARNRKKIPKGHCCPCLRYKRCRETHRKYARYWRGFAKNRVNVFLKKNCCKPLNGALTNQWRQHLAGLFKLFLNNCPKLALSVPLDGPFAKYVYQLQRPPQVTWIFEYATKESRYINYLYNCWVDISNIH